MMMDTSAGITAIELIPQGQTYFREEMLLLLKDCMYKNTKEANDEDGDDGVKDLIEMTMKKMDKDKDGRVSFSDFHETVKQVSRRRKNLNI